MSNPYPIPGWTASKPRAAGVQAWLAGDDSTATIWESERQLGIRIAETMPAMRVITALSREFVIRAARYCYGQGVRQFLHIGAGLLQKPMLHELLGQCRCVYVDAHTVTVWKLFQALETCGEAGLQSTFGADLRASEYLWAQAVTQGLRRRRPQHLTAAISPVRKRLTTSAILSPHEPIALILSSALEGLPRGAGTASAMEYYKRMLPDGSLVIATHATTDRVPREQARRAAQLPAIYAAAGLKRTHRSRAAFTSLFAGLDLLDPGVAWLPEWTFDDHEPRLWPNVASASCTLAVIGRKS